MNKFSKRLKNLREQHELTQEQLANILNITRSRLSMYEQGKREPTFEIQEAIADYFNVDLDYLMGRTDKKTDYVIVPDSYSMDKVIYGEEKASIIEFVKVANDAQMARITKMFELLYPQLWNDAEQDGD